MGVWWTRVPGVQGQAEFFSMTLPFPRRSLLDDTHDPGVQHWAWWGQSGRWVGAASSVLGAGWFSQWEEGSPTWSSLDALAIT